MRMTWEEEASSIIERVGASLPAETTYADRRKALLAAKPHHFASTSWGSKTWGKAQRKYLERFGLPPLPPKSIAQHMSPLERLMAASSASSDALSRRAGQ